MSSHEWKTLLRDAATVAILAYVSVRVQKAASSPDLVKSAKMRTALVVKRFSQKQADMWQRLAHDASTAYNALR